MTVVGCLSWLVLMAAQLAAQQAPPRLVSGPQISAMIRNTVIAIHQANVTGNYTVLRDLGALGFYVDKSATDLSDFFRPLREAKIDLTDTVIQEPLLSEQPKLSNDGSCSLRVGFQEKKRQREL